jgi:hypothetical protein
MSQTVDQVSAESLTVAITAAVSDVEACRPLSLPPLSDSIDLDALQSFCTPETPESVGTTIVPLVISFTYSDSVVHIDSGAQTTVSAELATDEALSHLDTSSNTGTDSLSHSDS